MDHDISSISALEQLSKRLYENSSQLGDLSRRSTISSLASNVHSSISDEQLEHNSILTPQDLRNKLKRDALEVFRLACSPEEYVAHISLNHQYTICLRYLCDFNVFAAVPTSNPISLNNLSIITSAPLIQLTSVIKMAATSGLFRVKEDRVSHTAASRLLATDASFNGWATCVTHQIFDASSHLAAASKKWHRSAETIHSPFSLAFDTTLSFPEYLRENPLVARTMGQFVGATQRVDGNDPRHLVQSYDWASLGEVTVIDVNTTSITPTVALSNTFPLLRFELEVQERAKKEIEEAIKALSGDSQARFSITSSGAEQSKSLPSTSSSKRVFLLRHFLHNLPDPIASKILTDTVSHLRTGDKILVQDLVIPESNEVDAYTEGMLRMRGMIQLEFANVQTRTLEMWERLIRSVGVGARMKSLVRPKGSDLSLMEVEICGDID